MASKGDTQFMRNVVIEENFHGSVCFCLTAAYASKSQTVAWEMAKFSAISSNGEPSS